MQNKESGQRIAANAEQDNRPIFYLLFYKNNISPSRRLSGKNFLVNILFVD